MSKIFGVLLKNTFLFSLKFLEFPVFAYVTLLRWMQLIKTLTSIFLL